jgi:hypothetical protein
MYLAKIIVYISILIWLLPPFRQIKGGYFLYFLILGYSDPLTLFFLWHLKLNPIYTHLIIALALTISIFYYTKILKIRWVVFLVLLFVLSLWLCDKNTLFIPIAIFRILIVWQLFVSSANEILLKHKINLYLSVLIFYELTSILKYIAVEINYTNGIYMFYLTLAFEMIICVFFIFYNLENSPLIKLPFSNKYEY